jgi:AcrR family transcriptional regulator
MRDRPYHHGDLHQALVSAGLAAAGEGGPDAIALRDLAKAVGVSPTAAYRHFPSLEHLVAAVAQRARERLATAMRDAMDSVVATDPAERAWRRLRASGRAYVEFATAEPNLFATAFVPCVAPPPRDDAPDAWSLLVGALEVLAQLGELAPSARQMAPVIAWSAVHGLAGILSSTAPPGAVTPAEATEAVLDGVQRALRA